MVPEKRVNKGANANVRVFRKDSRVLIRAASAAQRAADYIRGKVPAEEPKPATEPEPESLSV